MKYWKKNSVIIMLVGCALYGCDFIKMKADSEQTAMKTSPIARVHSQYLYADDIEGLAPAGMMKEDSAKRVQNYVNYWIRKQLLIQEATTKIEFDEAEIERQLLDYKYSLMGYKYQSFYVNQHLDTEVTREEIETYYKDNIDNFVLKQNIIRGKYIKLPVGAPKTEKVKALIRSNDPEKLNELNSYCLSFATAYQLDDSVWLVFDDVIRNSPLAEIPNKVQFLKNNKYTETADDQYLYFLKIQAYRISDNESPLEFVTEDIKNIIINKRKVKLAKKLEEDVYEHASKNNEFEIYP